MTKPLLLCLAILYSCLIWSQDSARIMFYNLLEFPEAPPANREFLLRDIINNIQPDVIMVAELQDQTGANLILDEALNDDGNIFAAAPFISNTSGSGGNIQQLLYYNTQKFNLELTDIIQTSLRDINRYQLKAKTTDESVNPIVLEFFVCHFKASQGSSNEQIRFNMALDFTNYINTNLSSDANVIFAGDFNFYSANESGFQQMFIGNTTIPMNDPIAQLGDWHTNSSFASVHTQSTRQSNNPFNDFGSGGGLDDRFDFIFVSGNILDQTNNAHYINGSYQTYGNNGNCYNDDISDSSCTGLYTQNTRNLLWNMSDHLPLVMDIEFNQNFLSVEEFDTAQIITLPKGNVVQQEVEVDINPNFLDRIHYLSIYNSYGNLVKTKSVKERKISIQLDDLSTGIYILKSDVGHTIKFVITR